MLIEDLKLDELCATYKRGRLGKTVYKSGLKSEKSIIVFSKTALIEAANYSL